MSLIGLIFVQATSVLNSEFNVHLEGLFTLHGAGFTLGDSFGKLLSMHISTQGLKVQRIPHYFSERPCTVPRLACRMGLSVATSQEMEVATV
ncbi:hypothetical protein F5Y13DRAFT_150866 [Hypoxylon sp. FL1857]|nr:hypothetical protein F5Y13DRAFT_150866 [Hypoxylon sp. FL1857]